MKKQLKMLSSDDSTQEKQPINCKTNVKVPENMPWTTK